MEPSEFDRLVTSWRKGIGADKVDHEHTLDAVIYVRDTLELCLAAARSLPVGGSIGLDQVIAIYDRIEGERKRRASAGRGMRGPMELGKDDL